MTDRADVPDVVDVVVPDAEAAMQVAEAVRRNPIAAMVLVRLLRHNLGVDVGDRLYAESLAYSALQHGAEFRAWLAARTRREPRP